MIPFDARSRRSRNRLYINTRNRIRQAAPVVGGLFVTHDLMHGRNGWIDAYFLGRKAPTFYFVALQTTRHAWKEALLRQIDRDLDPETRQHRIRLLADSGVIHVHEGWARQRGYPLSVGLHATVDVPWLTTDAVNDFIRRFLRTESDYRNPVPLSYRYDDVECWGVEVNVVRPACERRRVDNQFFVW